MFARLYGDFVDRALPIDQATGRHGRQQDFANNTINHERTAVPRIIASFCRNIFNSIIRE